jgi:peptide chain release factor subunit 1
MPSNKRGNSGGNDEKSAQDQQVEQWKIKRLIRTLEAARGNGTSMISLIVPPGDQVSRVNKMLGIELGTASNIKSRVNRQSVLGAITSVQQRLKQYNRVPDNGLVIYSGTVITNEGKEKKVSIDFEPFKPINTSLYLCDNKFHTEALNDLLQSDDKFGFIIMDGNGALYGTLSGNARAVLHKFSVDLPKKHGRGGQSALRFARLRLEKRQHYIRKVAELATNLFITNDECNMTGLILAGSAEFKTKLSQSDLFDGRLRDKIIQIVDVSYGGENGFNQAIELAAASLADVKFIREKKLLTAYFREISEDTKKFCYGVRDTLTALDRGAVSDLIVFENLAMNRYTLRHPLTGEETVKYFNEQQEGQTSNFVHSDGTEFDVLEKMPMLEWLTNEYVNYGCTLNFVSNRSQEVAQFQRGVVGIGGILRYVCDFTDFDELAAELEAQAAYGNGGSDSESDFAYSEDDIDGDFL